MTLVAQPSMNAYFPYLILVTALLWFPRHWLRVGSIFRRRRTPGTSRDGNEPWRTRETGDPQVRFGSEFSKFRNYVDLLRAGAGSLALMGGLGIPSCLEATEPAMKNTVLALRVVIMLVGVIVQTGRRERGRFSLYPAIFYIGGLTVGLCHPWAALFAFILIWAVNIMLSTAQAFLTVYAVFIVIFGYVLNPSELLSVASAGILAYAPALVGLLANRPLIIPSRKGTRVVN